MQEKKKWISTSF